MLLHSHSFLQRAVPEPVDGASAYRAASRSAKSASQSAPSISDAKTARRVKRHRPSRLPGHCAHCREGHASNERDSL
ncbi:hypothetical protein HMPREF1550_00130 [Actinomyces sp. oral taxon 877 str. F0543]|nr:hypothetical protein HMPREF1550_00130 [Actinomyces sp. oral taxon 877 str. F0543]